MVSKHQKEHELDDGNDYEKKEETGKHSAVDLDSVSMGKVDLENAK